MDSSLDDISQTRADVCCYLIINPNDLRLSRCFFCCSTTSILIVIFGFSWHVMTAIRWILVRYSYSRINSDHLSGPKILVSSTKFMLNQFDESFTFNDLLHMWLSLISHEFIHDVPSWGNCRMHILKFTSRNQGILGSKTKKNWQNCSVVYFF